MKSLNLLTVLVLSVGLAAAAVFAFFWMRGRRADAGAKDFGDELEGMVS